MTDDPIIEIDRLRMRFGSNAGSLLVLDDISLSIKEHEFFALLGPSGCGKSTLMLLVAGLMRPSSGTLRVQGKVLDGPFTNLGIAFQHHNLLEWRTVIQNVLLPVEVRGLKFDQYCERADRLIEMVGLTGFKDSFPHQLSGGMRQRAALCRALVCDQPLLLMDEPFGALDALTREEHQLMLQNVWMKERKTVLFITHDVREAILLADRVGVMSARPGNIVDILSIDLPRPREQSVSETPEFNAYVRAVRRLLDGTRSAACKESSPRL